MEYCTFFIFNKTKEIMQLIDFVNQLHEAEPIAQRYPLFRLQTDTYGVTNRILKPGLNEVSFHNSVNVIGRLMDKLFFGNIKDFMYLKIMEYDGTFLLPDGTSIDNPQTLARHHGSEYIYDKFRKEQEI